MMVRWFAWVALVIAARGEAGGGRSPFSEGDCCEQLTSNPAEINARSRNGSRGAGAWSWAGREDRA